MSKANISFLKSTTMGWHVHKAYANKEWVKSKFLEILDSYFFTTSFLLFSPRRADLLSLSPSKYLIVHNISGTPFSLRGTIGKKTESKGDCAMRKILG